MDKSNNILNVYNKHKTNMLNYALRAGNHKIGMDKDFMEQMVENILVFALTSSRAKEGFKDDEHIRKFMWNILRHQIKKNYAIKYRQSIPELTTKERIKNFELAKSIIDKARSVKVA
jgi:hypothetical protein